MTDYMNAPFAIKRELDRARSLADAYAGTFTYLHKRIAELVELNDVYEKALQDIDQARGDPQAIAFKALGRE